MNNNDNKIIDVFKVFFIVSNESNIDKELQFSLNNKGMTNLKKLFSKTFDKNILVSIYSFEFITKKLEDLDKDKNNKNYKALINGEYNNISFKGIIFFNELKNNFIYDFKFEQNEEIKNFNLGNVELSKMEQLKMYEEVLKKLKVKPGDPLLLDLILDSQKFFMNNNTKYYFDFYLEVFKLCYSRKEIKRLLMLFNLEKVNLPENIEINNYSKMMSLIEKKPDILTKYCIENDSKNLLLKRFCILLLYFRANYEKEKVSNLLNKKELWKFYIEILPLNYQFFSNIEIPEELINEILHQNKLSFEIIKGALSYIHSNKNKLIAINNSIDSIFEFCKKERNIKISELVFPNETDDLNDIIPEIEKIIKFQNTLHGKYILFDEDFWKKYIGFNEQSQDNKSLIQDAYLLYLNADRDANYKELAVNRKSEIIDLDAPIPFNKIKEENDKNENIIIEKRLVMPAIGNVSVGKSYFLNSLLGFDFCQVKSDITTKLILFIRHIDKLKEPRLYNIKPIANDNSYIFIKNSEDITGEYNIIEKIKNINSKLQINEESMFYMLEIEIKSIKNKTFLNKVDFLDIPGLNESDTDYFNLYFKYIKDMIKYCLIIFSTENYNSKDTLQVINKVKNNIYVPMENFLLILNKIDKVDGKIKETLHDFKKVLLNNEGIHFYDNTVIPVNSIKLKSEIQIETNFYHFINYYFIEYNNNENKLLPFLEYIKRKIKNVESDKKKMLKNEMGNIDKEQMIEIKNIFSVFVNDMKSKGEILKIDLEDDNEMNTLKIFYICFTKKILVPKTSNSLEKINNYFDNIKDYSFPSFGNEIKIEPFIEEDISLYNNVGEYVLLKNLDNFFNKYFNSPKIKKIGKIVDLLNDDFQVLKNYLLNSSIIYIPIIGVSNSGKSSFINCLIQKDILTCNSLECTRRGMIIRYIKDKNKISLYSIKFKSSKNLNQTYYYYRKYKLLSENIEDIKEIINITNESYPKNEEDCFFLLETNIQALDDLNIKPEIKNNICFIDFPGHNTNDNFFFDKKIYQKVLKMSSFFIYINGGKAFKEDANKLLLSKIFNEAINIRNGDISPKEYLELCLFIFNKVDSLEENERSLEGLNEDIKGILGLPNGFEINISCSFFSALIFKKYLKKKNDYNTENIIKNLYMEFKRQEEEIDDDDILFGNNNKESDFIEFIKINLLKNIKFDFYQSKINYHDKNIITSSKIYKELRESLEKYYKECNIIKNDKYENNLIIICDLLISCQEHLTKLNYFQESYAKNTFENIYLKINKSFDLKRQEYNNYMDRIFFFMNKFFRLDNAFPNIKAKSKYGKNSIECINKIEKIFKEFKGKEILEKSKNDILNYISSMEDKYDSLMQQNGNDLNKIINIIKKELLSKYTKVNNLINEEITNLEIKIVQEIQNAGLEEEEKEEENKDNLNYGGKLEEGRINNGKLSLPKKILLGVSVGVAITVILPFYGAYELFYDLPCSIKNKINKKGAFNKFLNEKKEEVKSKIKNFNKYMDNYIEGIRKLSLNNVDKLYGLLESNNFKIDNFWIEAKEVYTNLFNLYMEIKNQVNK